LQAIVFFHTPTICHGAKSRGHKEVDKKQFSLRFSAFVIYSGFQRQAVRISIQGGTGYGSTGSFPGGQLESWANRQK